MGGKQAAVDRTVDGPVAPGPVAFARTRELGWTSWMVLGIIALTIVVATALGAISGVFVPLVIAFIIGCVLEPLVRALERRGVRSVLAALVALLVAVLVAAGTIVVVMRGLLGEVPEISRQLVSGWNALVTWVASLDIDSTWLERARQAAEEYAPRLGHGAFWFATSAFSSVVSFAIGAFFAFFFLFFVLRDGQLFPVWLARAAHKDQALLVEVDTIAKDAIRGYFKGTALTAIITAPIFMIPLVLLGVPLLIPIFLLYFFLSFIPFVGAWLTGVFAVLIAFGSGGAKAAVIVLLSLLISNGTIQSAVSSWALGSSLSMHPAAVLIATMVGGTVAGILGMILAPPLLSAVFRSLKAIRARQPGLNDGLAGGDVVMGDG